MELNGNTGVNLWCCSYRNTEGQLKAINIEADTEELARIYCEELNLSLDGKLSATYEATMDCVEEQKEEMQGICDFMNGDIVKH